MPDDVDDCVESVLEDNPDYSESKAWAICKAQQEADVDVDGVDVEQLSDVSLEAEELDELVSETDTWARQASDHGVAWIDTVTGGTVFEAAEDGGIEQQGDPMTNGHQLDPGTGKGTCESTGEEIEAETMADLTEDCPYCGEPLSVLGTAQQQANGFTLDVIEVVQEGDDGPVEAGTVLGIGADFPNAGVYVDWNNDAWPEEEQLDEPHVSDYGTVEDLEQATGGVVNVVETVGPNEAGGRSGTPDGQLLVHKESLSQEERDTLREAIERRHNVTVTEVDDE